MKKNGVGLYQPDNTTFVTLVLEIINNTKLVTKTTINLSRKFSMKFTDEIGYEDHSTSREHTYPFTKFEQTQPTNLIATASLQLGFLNNW